MMRCAGARGATEQMQIFLVGGAVRDKLLGHPVQERDWVVVGATPQQMIDQGYTPVGRDFPVFLHPESREEYALARTERKVAPGYSGFTFNTHPSVTLEDDLLRRDLTINAMAEDAQGRLIDPYGGRNDLDNGLLKHVSPAFVEDPVRILRVARFAARFAHYGFHVAHSTNKLMSSMVASGEINALVAERVWAELYKALQCRSPLRFFQTLQGCSALPVLFPELVACIQESEQQHGKPLLLLPVLDTASGMTEDPLIRFAALLADADNCGELTGAQLDAFCTRLRIPGQFRDLAVMTLRFRARVHDAVRLTAGELLDILAGLDVFRRDERLARFIAVCAAEAHARDSTMHDYPPAQLLEQVYRAAAAAKVDPEGRSGKEIGELLRAARICAIEKILG